MTGDRKKWPAPTGSRKQARDFSVSLIGQLYANGSDHASQNRGLSSREKRGGVDCSRVMNRKTFAELAESQSSIIVVEGPRMREKRISEYMCENPKGNRCSRCGESVAIGPDTVACLCCRCTHLLTELRKAGYWGAKAKRRCPDCGAILVKRKQYCKSCVRKRAKKRERDKKRRKRKQLVALSPTG